MKTLLGFLFAVCSLSVAAQDNNRGKVSVSIFNNQQTAVENATVELRKAKDSSLVKTALSDKTGKVVFENIRFDNYFIKSSLVNFTTQFSAAFSISETNASVSIPSIAMEPGSVQLGNVTVNSRKPFIQKLSDRIVVNVEGSIISAGSSAMDVLERSPGTNVDQNDNITLRGKSGVIVMIDGKPSPMTGADLANYLKALPASALERIDIITNPSAKYDAAGNSGIIDIRMKKDQRFGINGTFSTGYGQGVYPKANGGSTFNYRNKKINIFGNYNYNYRVGLNHLLLDRNFYENSIYNGGDLKDNYSKSPSNANSSRLGMDFFPSKKTVLGFVVNGNFNQYKRNNDNSSIILNPQRKASSTFKSLATNDDHAENMVANINFKHRFDSAGKELTADVDYGDYRSNSMTVNATNYFKLDGTQQQPRYVLNGDQKGKLNFKTAKIDYVNPLGKDSKWEAGLKTSLVSSDNDARFTDVSNGSPQNDINKTNHFLYKENNNAGYLNLSKTFKKLDMQFGLRGEHTKISTYQAIGNVSFDSSYFQMFPSSFFNYKLKKEQTLGLSVSRRIDRPGYSQLNPFLFLIDVTTYSTGRPGLLPQLTWAYELSYTVKNFNVGLSYSHAKNNQNTTLARFKEVFPNIPSEENVTVQIPINLSSSDYVGLSVSAPIQVKGWWNMTNNANFFFEKFYANFSGTRLNSGRPALDIRTNNTFTFKKGWNAELNGSFNSGGQFGFMVLDPRWGISTGVQKSVMQKKGTVRFNITDIFWTNLPKAVVTFNNYVEKWHAFRETRVANLSFTYRFGNNKVQAARRRTTASEEERQRVGN
jgi:iron complex outermembrane recepter protein